MTDLWEMPAELGLPSPRATKPTRRFIGGVIFSILFFMVFGGAVLWQALGDYHKDFIRRHGLPAVGRVLALHTEHHRKGGNDYIVDYAYAGEHFATYQQTAKLYYDDYRQLQIGRPLAVMYNPQHPREAVVQNEKLFDPLALASLAILLVLLVFLMRAGWKGYAKSRRLLQWGVAAMARITHTEFVTTRRQVTATVTYVFVDGQGKTVEGKRTNIPARSASRWSSADPSVAEEYADMLAFPTVVYDPQDSAQNLLYPPLQVAIDRRGAPGAPKAAPGNPFIRN